MRPHILIAEDQLLIAAVLREAVQEIGADCIGPFANLDEALGAATVAPIDTAILDIDLLHRDCYPIADTLDARGIPFGFVTGYPLGSIDRRWADRPVLAKPFSFDDLRDLIRHLLHAA